MARIAGEAPRTGRVTRSQSRELDDPLQDRNSRWDIVSGKQASSANRMSTVAEYSPPKSPQKPGLAGGTSAVPESPGNYEGNISGTTFLPQEESDPDDGALEPIIMIDELPGLQEATDRLLHLVKASAPDAKQAVDAARKLANPRNTENKRLKPAIRKLMTQMKPFGAQRFIDVAEAQRLIPTVQPKDADRPWSPLPALQRANCARMVLDLLLAGMGLNSHSEAIRALDSQFPEPFMSQVVEGNEPSPIGGSAALKSTFELALEIRTQFAIVELEREEKGLNARSVIESVFYGDGYTSENDPLRGFSLQGTFADENGHLPSQFQDKVNDRFSELDFNLYDDEGNLDIKGLKSAFRNRFLISTARFVQIRDKELRQHLHLQPKLEDVKEFVEQMIEDGANADDQETSEQHLSAIPSTPDRSPEENEGGEEQEGGENAEENKKKPDYESDTSANQLFVPWSPSPLRRQQDAPMSPEQGSPSQPAKEPTPKSAHRRQSSKQSGIIRKLDYLKKRREARQRQETTGGSEADTSRLSDSHDVSFPSPGEVIRNPGAVTIPREVSQTPDEDLRYPLLDNDDTLLNDREELDLTNHRHNELMQSTSPPGSERTRQRYNQGRFFDSPPRNQFGGANNPDQRRTLLDQQENRTRVSWSSEDESQLTERRRSQKNPPTQETTKRRRDEDIGESDEDSDDAFEQPQPSKATASPMARKVLQQPNKRRRTDTDEDANAAADQLQSDLIASRTINRAQAEIAQAQRESTQTRSAEPETSHIARSRAEALHLSPSQTRWSQANDPTQRDPVPNIRRRWSADENERLISLIARHGTAWALIKSQDDICPKADGGPKLQGRTQVNLKDRARNLKRQYEREGTALPPNFEFISA